MARYGPEHKAGTRRKLVDTALNRFREKGVDSTSIDEVMKGLGLTVGGFYRHFGSKSELLVDAVTKGVEQSIAFIRSVPPGPVQAWFEEVAKRYLSCAHRDSIAHGCALAALGPEIARSDEVVRQACEAGLVRLRKAVEDHLGASAPEAMEQLWAFLALCMGGLILARMVQGKEMSDDILQACRNGAAALAPSSAKADLPADPRK
jgi:TetR/AcrR family transcriptional repressor of nem operon